MGRYFALIGMALGVGVGIILTMVGFAAGPWVLMVAVPFTLLGIYDVLQARHTLWRNYPIISHMRWVFEGIRPEIRQYLIESDADAFPFNREQRSLVYQRAKNELQTIPFGTQQDVYASGYTFFSHSFKPEHVDPASLRITVGGPDCKQPYSCSLLNVSAMSFGALSGNAIAALNRGAKIGGFAHDTGEGGISKYHWAQGGDIIWELGSGYFGCRNNEGGFDADIFAEKAKHPQIKMIEIKLSQGAKPGHGGMLPGAKVTQEIADARGVPIGTDCISPAAHSEFSTPLGLIDFISKLRELSGGKPVGFKLCVGHRREFMAVIKAMLKRDVYPDFIVIDGKEGGTGAAPLEFATACTSSIWRLSGLESVIGLSSGPAARLFPVRTWRAPWDWARIGVIRPVGLCSQSAVYRRGRVTPIVARLGLRHKIRCVSLVCTSAIKRNGSRISTAIP
jgi:glutamate synthase domain-containing protein 2